MICIIFLLFRGVLETLIRRHFPAPVSALASIDWSLLENDPTLPRSCRRRKRAAPRPRTTTFQDDTMMSDSDDSSSPGGSDSAMESSSDDENDKGETSDDSDSDSSSEGKSSSLDSDKEDFNPFGSSGKLYFIHRVHCICIFGVLILEISLHG